MKPEPRSTEPRSTARGLRSCGWAALLGFAASAAFASAPSIGLKTQLIVDGPDAERACGSTIPLSLRVRNRDRHPITMESIRRLETAMSGHPAQTTKPQAVEDPAPGDPEVLPLPLTDWPAQPTRLRLSADLKLPEEIAAAARTRLPLELVRPQAEGYYTDVAQLEWSYPVSLDTDKGARLEARATIHYRVDGECIRILDIDAFHAATEERRSISVIGPDGPAVLDSVSGFEGPRRANPVARKAIRVDADGEPGDLIFNDDLFDLPEGDSQELTYCVRVSYYDGWLGCPSNTVGMKWWQPYCNFNLQVPMLGLEVRLWDRDFNSMDDMIGTYTLHYEDLGDYACLDFTWDPVSRGEPAPDVYVSTLFDVQDTEFNAGQKAHLCHSNQTSKDACDDRRSYDWRDSYTPNLTPGDPVYQDLNFGPSGTLWNRWAMTMASVQKVLRSFQGRHMTGDLNVWWNGTRCRDDDGDPWSCSWDDNWFSVANQNSHRWVVGPHEAGHSYQMQLFEQSTLPGSGCGSEHFVDGVENDACATKEGWADFFSILTWYTGPDAKNNGNPRFGSRSVETGSPPHADCADNARTELQVMRSLWDMYDDRIDGMDVSAMPRWGILASWDSFANGSGNHNDKETGRNGGNLWDFHFNAASGFQTTIDMAMDQNDTDCQSTN